MSRALVVTGCSSGIGRACVTRLARAGLLGRGVSRDAAERGVLHVEARARGVLGALRLDLAPASVAASVVEPWQTRTAILDKTRRGLVYLVEHASLNAEIGSGSLSPAEVEAALRRWRAWHWVRAGAGALGFLAGLAGLGRGAARG
jgi:NAD(P)-dependent dehydrogenase (short-subunit alcohol dehydrogenase family)